MLISSFEDILENEDKVRDRPRATTPSACLLRHWYGLGSAHGASAPYPQAQQAVRWHGAAAVVPSVAPTTSTLASTTRTKRY